MSIGLWSNVPRNTFEICGNSTELFASVQLQAVKTILAAGLVGHSSHGAGKVEGPRLASHGDSIAVILESLQKIFRQTRGLFPKDQVDLSGEADLVVGLRGFLSDESQIRSLC